jgi:hypothetical protein
MANYRARFETLRVGVVGLGVASLAVYGEQGDVFRFYEINPDIISLARGEGGHFTYLQDTKAEVEIVPGDARVSLEREIAEGNAQQFDILAVDAFSGDSIPVHLLTTEAFQVYLQHIRPGGLLALHISNRYLNLTPVVKQQGELLDLYHGMIFHSGDRPHGSPTRWVFFSRDNTFFLSRAVQDSLTPYPDEPHALRTWTDDYSNLFQVLNR